MTSAESDPDVIASSLEQPERFEAIFDRHAVAIYRYLRRRVGEQLAEELAAETFARALRARAQFDSRQGSALPWLYGIAINLIRMQARSEQRRRRAYRRLPHSSPGALAIADAEARLDAERLRPALSAALARLTADEREILLLHAWAGLSPAEIAAALALSPATVRKRLHRARSKASRLLELHRAEPIGACRKTRSAP